MIRRTRPLLLCGLFFTGVVLAQQPAASLPIPRVTSLSPPGAKANSTLLVTVNGTDLDESPQLIFSHPGISATPYQEPDPKPDPKAKDKTPPKKKNGPTPTSVTFQITVKDSVPAGLYDVRVSSRNGVSNPRFFTVGTLNEVNETEPNNDVPVAQKIELGTTVNGIISSPTDVDFFQFTATAGQRVLIHCAAGSIESRAKPLLELFTSEGRRLAQNRNDHETDALIDAKIPANGTYFIRLCEFAYQYGGPDSFYRLTLFSGPWVDAVYPPVVEPGKESPVTLIGRGLPESAVKQMIKAPAKSGELTGNLKYNPTSALLDGFEFHLPGSPFGVPVYLAREPVVLEADRPNDTADTAQTLTLPCELCGRIDVKYDQDWYRFSAKKGEALMIDLAAKKLGSKIDCYLSIVDAKTNREIVNENQLDDETDALHPVRFYSRTEDPSAFRFVPPADGDYLIRVASRDGNVSFGPRAIYRLRISPPRPDYRVVLMPHSRELPSAVICRPGNETAVDVFVHRIDGFSAPVTVNLTNLPPGMTATPAVIGSGQKWGTIVLKAAPGKFSFAGMVGFLPRFVTESKEITGTMTAEASAVSGTSTVKRSVRTATITWGINQGANNPTATRLDQTLPIALRDNYAVPTLLLTGQFDKATLKTRDGKDSTAKFPLTVRPGDKVTVPFQVTYTGKDRPAVNLYLEPTHSDNQKIPFSNVNNNNNNPIATIAKEKADAPVTFDLKPTVAPGRYRIMVRAEVAANLAKSGDKKAANNIGIQSFVPVDFNVVPVTLAKVSANPATVKLGGKGELVVRVERQFDYEGEFEVEVKYPEGKGLSSVKTVIPAGKDFVRIPIVMAKEAKPGNVSNITITATARYEGTVEVKQETKVNVNITK
ncbi:MAG: PPC domain-containing protein [Gemmataceae bacterium]